MRRFLTYLPLIFLFLPSAAQRPRIGLALGGGGAKGAAEVGVLKVLEEEGIPVDYIAGTSIGSIVGGLYSVGYRSDYLRDLFHTADWGMLLSDRQVRKTETLYSRKGSETYIVSVPAPFLRQKKGTTKSSTSMTKGLVSGQNLVNFFSGLTIGYHDVSDFLRLPIPFTCVATDLVTGNEVHLRSGSLSRAMRASMSIPGMFEPVDWGDSLLVDGGTANNFPVDVVRQMGADIVIGVDLSQSQGRTKKELRGMSSVLSQLINIMGQRKYQENRSKVDFYINPDLKGYGAMSFSQAATDTMYLRGYAAADKLRPQLRALKASWGEDTVTRQLPNEPQTKSDFLGTRFSVGPIHIEGISERYRDWLLSKVGIKEYSTATQTDIDAAIDALRGLNIFSSVSYTLSSAAPYPLTFTVEEYQSDVINVGARFDSQDLAAVLVNLSNMQHFSTRHHYSASGRISQNPYFDIEYNYGNLFGPRLGVEYLYRYSDFDRFGKYHKLEALTFHTHSISTFLLYNFSQMQLKAGVQLDLFHFSKNLSRNDNYEPLSGRDHYLNYFASFLLDTYNRRYFPTHGWRLSVNGTLHTDNGAEYHHHTPFGSLSASAERACRLNKHFSLLPAVQGRFVFGDNAQRIYGNYVGGLYDAIYFPQQQAMPTVLHLHAVADKYLSARTTLRYRMKDNIYFAAIGELGKADDELSGLLAGTTLWGVTAQAAYDFMLGPVSAQLMYSSLYRRVSFFLNAGFYF